MVYKEGNSMPVNSCRKGKAGEREAVAQLRSWGFSGARRTQQHNGAEGLSDVVCDDLRGLHIEVKRVGSQSSFRPGTQLLQDACDQAERDSKGEPWVVLWRPQRSQWWSATARVADLLVTVAGDDVPEFLRRLNNQQAEAAS